MDFLHFIAQYRTPEADLFFQGITYLAQEVFVIAIICWLFWCSNKKLAYTLGFSYFLSGLLVQALKITFRIPRPWILDPLLGRFPLHLPGQPDTRFQAAIPKASQLFSERLPCTQKNGIRSFSAQQSLCW